MDMTKNGYISWYEFDLFVRLYQPWDRMLNNWRIIVLHHPGFKMYMTYNEVQKCLLPLEHKVGRLVFGLSLSLVWFGVGLVWFGLVELVWFGRI
eukprot:Pgem_evm1s14985